MNRSIILLPFNPLLVSRKPHTQRVAVHGSHYVTDILPGGGRRLVWAGVYDCYITTVHGKAVDEYDQNLT